MLANCKMESSSELLGFGSFQARPALDISVKSDRTSAFPILRIVAIDPWAMTECAEKRVLRGIDDNSDMPAPDHQVPWLRMFHAPKLISSVEEIRRTRIRI